MATLTSKLEAVNIILGAVGEAPVSSLTNTTQDAAISMGVLDEISRVVQSEGWNFNIEEDVPFIPDTDGKIQLSENILSFDVDPLVYYKINPVPRGLTLYDAENHTDIFTSKLEARVTYLLDFTELPECARYYIAVRAARVYHDRYVGSAEVHRYSSEDEVRARVALLHNESDSLDCNIFQSQSMRSMLRR